MVPELEKPRVTEIYVRMDCNGCVQKIKKALSGINGIYDTYIDFPKQKVTIIGWAEPDKIIKAIKKTKKNAIVCSHTEPTESTEPPTEPPPPEAAAAPDAATSPTEPPPDENSPPPPEPPKDPPPPETPTPLENKEPEMPTQPPATLENPPQPKDLEQIHVIHHHHPQDNRYGYSSFWNDQQYDRGHWQNYPHELRTNQPMYSYNNCTPSPYVSGYYQTARSPPQPTDYRTEQHHNGEYGNYDSTNGDRNSITSMFSDENPNACTIV